uniref:Uncharacterized protein n=1 Tax=Cucumis melo TaxID=3656 RepID=A0A9I9CCE6_CUCME
GAHATAVFPLFHSTTVGREKHDENGRTACSSARDEERKRASEMTEMKGERASDRSGRTRRQLAVRGQHCEATTTKTKEA